MSVHLAGQSHTQYKNRCADDLRCICKARGDWSVFIDGSGPYCLIIDQEYQKEYLGDVGVNTSTIEAVWVEADCLPIKKNSILVTGSDQYRVDESPVKLHDGWMKAKLKLTCEC